MTIPATWRSLNLGSRISRYAAVPGSRCAAPTHPIVVVLSKEHKYHLPTRSLDGALNGIAYICILFLACRGVEFVFRVQVRWRCGVPLPPPG